MQTHFPCLYTLRAHKEENLIKPYYASDKNKNMIQTSSLQKEEDVRVSRNFT